MRYILASFKNPGLGRLEGGGTGLFEYLLRTRHGIEIQFGVEPSEVMAEIATKRGGPPGCSGILYQLAALARGGRPRKDLTRDPYPV